ncbi:insulin-degrading protein [Nitzschia inconspicua]|uniref:Insulin-degrading protein n=1 Tax=Nitzschia inconspicua TaxID=303405 RepID=A0A9K3L7U4_9STRA|nr:insulin-degrading protein [Nitzschia inconspicua]
MGKVPGEECQFTDETHFPTTLNIIWKEEAQMWKEIRRAEQEGDVLACDHDLRNKSEGRNRRRAFDTSVGLRRVVLPQKRREANVGWTTTILFLSVLSFLKKDPMCASAFTPSFRLANRWQQPSRHDKVIGRFASFEPGLCMTSSDCHSNPEDTHQQLSTSPTCDIPESVRRRRLLLSLLATAAGSSAASAPIPATADDESFNDSIAGTIATMDWSTIEVMKPPLDDRDYKLMLLDNGLRVVLCSDPSSNEAGAAMDVHVGACSDPKDIPGLAHFNEHMLFLGTKEYPKEDSFEEFLSANGGSSNAYTASENTVYYFTLQAESDQRLLEGLKRFGSFFTSPLFTEGATGRELNAIESEHAKNLQTDSFRVYQINKERQNMEHPHSKFFTGNKKTLLEETKRKGLDLRQALIDFYSRYYSADQMTLAIVGPQSISTLKEMTENAFSGISNRLVGPPEQAWKGTIPPYDNGNSKIPSFGHIVKVLPVQDLRQVTVTWPIVYKDDQDRDYALLTKQAQYVSHIIGHEGPGSLLSYLKSKGWANSLEAAGESDLSDFETFEVTVGLTKAGLNNVNEVIESIFSCLRMLRDQAIPTYVFNEVLQLEELQWRYFSKSGVGTYVQSLATTLQDYPPSLCVAGPRRLALCDEKSALLTSSTPRTSFDMSGQLSFTKDLASNFISNLTVENAMFTILSKSFRGETNQVEEWYGTNYRADPVPESTMEKWKNSIQPSKLGISYPKPNPFIPSESGLKVKFLPSKSLSRPRTFEDRMIAVPPPNIIRDDGSEGRWTVYYKPDDKFGQPKAFVIFQLLTKQVYSSAKAAALSNLYEFSLTDKLGEYAYDAGLAGLTYDVRVVPRGVRLTFGGYNDKLQKFASYVSKKIASDLKDILPKNEAEFERYKDILMRSFAAFDFKQPYQHCSYFSQLMTQPTSFQYSNKELLGATESATLDELKDYVGRIWSSGKGMALVQGNLFEEEALALVATIDKALGFKPIDADDYPPELAPLPLPQSPANTLGTRLTISEPNEDNGNAASYVAIQSLSEDPKEHVLIELVSTIVSEPFYENLRTKQQLGYIVSSGVRPVGKTKTLGFIVQSSSAKNEKLTKEIIKFLDGIRENYLEKLPKGDLAVFVKSLIDRKTEPDKQLATEVTRNWAEIASGRLEFDRTQNEVAALLSIEKEDLVEFWDRFYMRDGRRILVTEMIPQTGVASSPAPPKSTGYILTASSISKSSGLVLGIDDIQKYRQEREKLV